MAWNQFWRIAAGRLAFSLGRVSADSYRSLCKEVAETFELSARPGLISNGYDIVFQDYLRGDQIVSLEWDNWMGFLVVAQTTESEPMVQEIGNWLLKSKWATETSSGLDSIRADVFANDGGPSIAMDAASAHLWHGQPDTVHDEPAGDYGLACGSDYPAGIVSKDGMTAVIIGAKEGIGHLRWHSEGPKKAFLIGCAFADDDAFDELVLALHNDRPLDWVPLGTMEVSSGKVLLFHAACEGCDLEVDPQREVAFIGHAISVALTLGNYALAACEVSWPDRGLFNVVKWEGI